MNEFLIIQNNLLGALSIHSFTKEFCKENKDELGPTLPLIMPLLPLVFNERCRDSLVGVKRITQSRFLTTLADSRDIPAGLQKRMEEMSDQTMDSLNFAFSLNLLSYENEKGELYVVKRIRNFPKMHYKDNQDILHASKVLGNWFASFTIEEICLSLNIVF
jgi:hypothetical protein